MRLYDGLGFGKRMAGRVTGRKAQLGWGGWAANGLDALSSNAASNGTTATRRGIGLARGVTRAVNKMATVTSSCGKAALKPPQSRRVAW